MNNCIFTPHCTEMCCDQSRPKLAQTSYLLERNGISINSPVFRAKADKVEKVKSILNDKNAISILIILLKSGRKPTVKLFPLLPLTELILHISTMICNRR